MISQLVVGVGMDEGAERAAVDDEPGDEGAELGGREEVYFEHAHRMRSDWLRPYLIDTQFGD